MSGITPAFSVVSCCVTDGRKDPSLETYIYCVLVLPHSLTAPAGVSEVMCVSIFSRSKMYGMRVRTWFVLLLSLFSLLVYY